MQPVRIQVLEQGGSNHPGLAKGAKPLRLHRYIKGILNCSSSIFLSRSYSSLCGEDNADYEYGEARQAGGQICGRCVAGQLLEYQPCVPPPKYSSTNQFFKTTSKSICTFCPKKYICSAENETGLLKEVPVDCWETPFPNNSCQSEVACLCGTS